MGLVVLQHHPKPSGPGTEPVSPALAGGFLSTTPLGKPKKQVVLTNILMHPVDGCRARVLSPALPLYQPCAVAGRLKRGRLGVGTLAAGA